jgi:lysophospholipase L1-like esterase
MAVVLNEIFIRVFSPFDIRIKGDKIVLPVNRQYVINNNTIDKLDETIIHKKNSIGFRGKEPPRDFQDYLTIITIGGSTTECFNQSEGKTWTDILGKFLERKFDKLWINNAGLDGNSTFGHIILMQDYIVNMKPRIVLFMVGLNDEGATNIGEFDRENIKEGISFKSFKSFMKTFGAYSDVISILNNKYRSIRDRFKGVQVGDVDFNKLKYADVNINIRKERINIQKEKFLPVYTNRLLKLIDISKSNGIEPVFITQPALYGDAIDIVTGKDLSRISFGEINGGLAWDILEVYNDTVREVGLKENIYVIDLARNMPKETSYYYDFVHFSNKGSEKAAKIIYEQLYKILIDKYAVYQKK